jgi:hypothetical protein
VTRFVRVDHAVDGLHHAVREVQREHHVPIAVVGDCAGLPVRLHDLVLAASFHIRRNPPEGAGSSSTMLSIPGGLTGTLMPRCLLEDSTWHVHFRVTSGARWLPSVQGTQTLDKAAAHHALASGFSKGYIVAAAIMALALVITLVTIRVTPGGPVGSEPDGGAGRLTRIPGQPQHRGRPPAVTGTGGLPHTGSPLPGQRQSHPDVHAGHEGRHMLVLVRARGRCDQRSFLLQRAQPAMTGLIDGSLSTLAPIFTVAFATHQPRDAFLAGLATAIGTGVSMAFSEGLSDTGGLTGRGSPFLRGAITGLGTFRSAGSTVGDELAGPNRR